MSRMGGPGPFAALGLPARAGLTDDEVRAAWRRIASATHPDRADGGDPARFAAAAAAYTALRTRSGRGEALAELARPAGRGGALAELAGRPGPGMLAGAQSGKADRARGGKAGRARASMAGLLTRARDGRPVLLLVRLAATAAVTALAVTTAGWAPATFAVMTGALTWLLLTARHDLAPPS